MLRQFTEIPEGLLACDANQLHAFLGGPSLIHLSGRRNPALFVSVLMHGNETTGWDAAKALLAKYYDGFSVQQRPRSLSLFIANTRAAAEQRRHLPDQPDFNRVWPGSELALTPEHELMQSVFECMRQRGVFASIDIHNNTGLNPHYACINRLDTASLKLATLFARTVVYFLRPLGVQSIAMSQLCPAVTLECGKAGQGFGLEHAFGFLDACVHMQSFLGASVAAHDIDLFHTTAIVKVLHHISFGFDNPELDLCLDGEIERYNFRELEKGVSFGRVADATDPVLSVTNEVGECAFDQYFEVVDHALRTRKRVMPSMLTNNLDVVRQDCLCYLMERYTLPA